MRRTNENHSISYIFGNKLNPFVPTDSPLAHFIETQQAHSCVRLYSSEAAGPADRRERGCVLTYGNGTLELGLSLKFFVKSKAHFSEFLEAN